MGLLSCFLGISESLALKWSDIEGTRNQIRVRRAWVRGNKNDPASRIGEPKSRASRAPVPMHPVLAAVLQAWHCETMYGKPDDWIFASFTKRGAQPRMASTMSTRYIRPTAVKLGIIDQSNRRFGAQYAPQSLQLVADRRIQSRSREKDAAPYQHRYDTCIRAHGWGTHRRATASPWEDDPREPDPVNGGKNGGSLD